MRSIARLIGRVTIPGRLAIICLGLLCIAPTARADSAKDPEVSPRFLVRLIASANRSGDPLKSQVFIHNGHKFTYSLREVSTLGKIQTPFGVAHLALFTFWRSTVLDSEFPPGRDHTFLVFFDAKLRVRGHWEIDYDDAKRLSGDGTKVMCGDEVVVDFAHLPAPDKENDGAITVFFADRFYQVPRW